MKAYCIGVILPVLVIASAIAQGAFPEKRFLYKMGFTILASTIVALSVLWVWQGE